MLHFIWKSFAVLSFGLLSSGDILSGGKHENETKEKTQRFLENGLSGWIPSKCSAWHTLSNTVKHGSHSYKPRQASLFFAKLTQEIWAESERVEQISRVNSFSLDERQTILSSFLEIREFHGIPKHQTTIWLVSLGEHWNLPRMIHLLFARNSYRHPEVARTSDYAKDMKIDLHIQDLRPTGQ